MTDETLDPAGNADAGTDKAVETTTDTTANTADAGAGDGKEAVAKEAGTIAADDPVDKPVTTQADWPDDWREKLAGNDEKFLAHLKRYTSPANYAKAGFDAQQKIRTGEFKKPLGKDASAEELATWRKENGVPENAKDYTLDLGGLVPGENDKPILDEFKEFAHSENWAPEQLNKVAKWYFEKQEAALAEQAINDKAFKQESEEALRSEWGAEFRSNVNAMRNFLESSAPEGLVDRLFGARLADGRLLGNDPDALRWLTQMARDFEPAAGLVPAGTSNVGKGMTDRISELETMMREDERKYYSSGADQELMKLYDAQNRMKGRAA